MNRKTSDSRTVGRTDGTPAAALLLILSLSPTVRLSAQDNVSQLALRFSAMTAVSGYEQAVADSLVGLVPGQAAKGPVGHKGVTLARAKRTRLRARARADT